MSTHSNFIVFYKLSNLSFRTYNYRFQRFDTISKLQYDSNQYEMLTKCIDELNDENLKIYADELVIARNKLLSSKTLKIKFDYFDDSFKMSNGQYYYRNHSNNVKSFLKRLIKKQYLNFEPIILLEESYFNKTYKGGISTGYPGTYQCTTYDFKFFYPSILASTEFQIATTEGVMKEIKTVLPKKFKYGIYNVKITSEDEFFNMLFAFSKENHYTHYSLNFVLEYNKYYEGKIELEFMSNQALMYNDLIDSSDIFYIWYVNLWKLKKEMPKNKLIKKLASSCWGELQSQKKFWKTEDEVIDEKLDIGFEYENDYHIEEIRTKPSGDIYRLINLKKDIYEFQFRLKAFLTDFGRVKIAKIALQNINNVVRIQTDSITYNEPIILNINNFVIDEKKTGKMEILNRKIMRPIVE